MKHSIPIALLLTVGTVAAQQPQHASPETHPETQAEPQPTHLTIYNGDFAVARTTVPLKLHPGMNEVLTTSVTSRLEPDSVVLRDPSTHNPVPVFEQNYDAGVVTQAWLLEKYEGKTIDFQAPGPQGTPGPIVQGRIIRAGDNPLVEVNGKMQFQLPGTPLFPVETDGLVLKPTLRWLIDAKQAATIPAELDYITHGMQWHATYNVIVPETSESTAQESADLLGWVTIENNTGAEFPQATIELMAGDVAKLAETVRPVAAKGRAYSMAVMAPAPQVTQKDFDEFHLYDLHRTVTLRNGETKQVQFMDAAGVTVERLYEFEGTPDSGIVFAPGYYNADTGDYTQELTHAAIKEQFKNSAANHLGIPIPAGRLRLYRRDSNGAVQFVGESMIPHTPAEQMVHFTTGHAFDVTAKQRQTEFHVNDKARTMDESFEVKLANQKAQPVTLHVVEHMNRAQNWQVTAKSHDFTKRDSATIDFPVQIAAKGEATLTYSVHYSW
jgi:hypothetical protein